jgi:serine protease AprX
MHVKSLLARTARPLTDTSQDAQGAGEIDVAGAIVANGGWSADANGTGRGSLEAARGGVHLLDSGISLTGEKDILGGTWDPARMALATQLSQAWTKEVTAFNGNDWIGAGWVDPTARCASWTGKKWTGQAWTGKKWTGEVWSGESWEGKTTSTKTWTGTSWTGTGWESEVTLSTLAGKIWATSAWK